MNKITQQLQSLVTGTLSSDNQILNTCRLDVFGSSIWGHRAIVEYFIENPLREAFEAPHIVSSQNFVALMGVNHNSDEFGIFCETINGNIIRIWVVGSKIGKRSQQNDYVSVAFDPMLSQVPDCVGFSVNEHSELSSLGAIHTDHIARQICLANSSKNGNGRPRKKAFVLRAFSDDQQGAALLAIHSLQLDRTRQSSFHFSVITFRFSDKQLLHVMKAEDFINPNAWTPRIEEPELEIPDHELIVQR